MARRLEYNELSLQVTSIVNASPGTSSANDKKLILDSISILRKKLGADRNALQAVGVNEMKDDPEELRRVEEELLATRASMGRISRNLKQLGNVL